MTALAMKVLLQPPDKDEVLQEVTWELVTSRLRGHKWHIGKG